ncbi:7-cyano-7-deazaguanine synthase [Paenibacillus sp. NPDC058174]|uniref:7-cyano-7-deazaguanine synthase n=1 Tax=Paenibacillus sp. NPDC058174 TaxID=3346366 RepID=UPI0036DA197B
MGKNKIVLLFSGGIDSTVLYYWLNATDYDVFPIHINYGQTTYLGEINAIKRITEGMFKRDTLFVDVPNLKEIGQGSLVGELPESVYSQDEWMKNEFFPNRNMILISIAASYAYKMNINKLAIGVAGENSYKDTGSAFIKSITNTLYESLNLFEIVTPFVDKDRKFVVNESQILNVPIEKTFSCNSLGERHCMLCNSCLDRQHALDLLGIANAF